MSQWITIKAQNTSENLEKVTSVMSVFLVAFALRKTISSIKNSVKIKSKNCNFQEQVLS